MDFEVQTFVFFCPCAGLVHFKLQNMCFFVPVQVLCILQLKPSVCFVPAEVWYDSWLAIKMYYSAGYWNCLLKCDVFPLFLLVSWLRFFFKIILFDVGRELNLIKRHFVFKNRISLLIKLYILEQGLLHHKRTRLVKGNAIQNRKESRSWFLERRMLLRHSVRCVQTV